MAVTTQKLGPGILRFGETGTEQEFGSQVTKAELKPEYDTEDAVPVLSGEEVGGDETESYALAGEFLQEFSMASLIAWCKANSGTVLPFVFVPNTNAGFQVTGSVRIRAVAIGGDVKKSNTTEFEFPGIGEWDLTEYTAPVG